MTLRFRQKLSAPPAFARAAGALTLAALATGCATVPGQDGGTPEGGQKVGVTFNSPITIRAHNADARTSCQNVREIKILGTGFTWENPDGECLAQQQKLARASMDVEAISSLMNHKDPLISLVALASVLSRNPELKMQITGEKPMIAPSIVSDQLAANDPIRRGTARQIFLGLDRDGQNAITDDLKKRGYQQAQIDSMLISNGVLSAQSCFAREAQGNRIVIIQLPSCEAPALIIVPAAGAASAPAP